MMRFFRQLTAWMLCLFLLWGAAFALAEGETAAISGVKSRAMDEETERIIRFGDEAVVETGEDGEPVSVNGYPLRAVRVGFSNPGQSTTYQMMVDFVEYPFWQPATRYDGNLAVMSLMMSGCASRASGFQDISDKDFDPSLNLEYFLSDAGFSDIRKDDYSKVPTMFTVSTAMGHRKMTHEGEEPFTLIAVGVCGSGYKTSGNPT